MNLLTPWWSDFGTFLQMGKHGAYGWPAFGLCALAPLPAIALDGPGPAPAAFRVRAGPVAPAASVAVAARVVSEPRA